MVYQIDAVIGRSGTGLAPPVGARERLPADTAEQEVLMRYAAVGLCGLLLLAGCGDTDVVAPAADDDLALSPMLSMHRGGGVTTANGWYEEEEIYYVLLGVEEGVTQRGENDLYLIGGDRVYQANVAESRARRATRPTGT
jgi:hypothetical protein